MPRRSAAQLGIPTMAVGVILDGPQAEAILQAGQADLIAIGREVLTDPHWALHAAQALGEDPDWSALAALLWLVAGAARADRHRSLSDALACRPGRSEDDGSLGAQLPSRTEFGAQRVIIGAGDQVHRQLAEYLISRPPWAPTGKVHLAPPECQLAVIIGAVPANQPPPKL